ncbi:hypothetical protein KC349_g6427 [Hortaea werneckii]|nr:hypothetical protein KC349_g6427 [Hortaea werneckii]
MTSYQTRGEPFFPVNGGSNYMSADDVKYPNVLVTNGDQLGLNATINGSGHSFALYNDSDPELYAACVGYHEARFGQVEELWHQNWHPFFSAYDTAFAIHVRNTTYDLDIPIDLSTNFNYPPSPDEPYTSGGLISRLNQPPDADSSTFFALEYGDTELYSGPEIAAEGKCLPSKDYVWGFSSLMLFTFCMLTILILLLLIVLHYDAYCNSMADRYKLQISAFRDVLDLAEELRAHYGETEAASMSAPELDKSMQTDPAMIGLETATLHKARAAGWKQGSLRLRVPKWAKRRRASGVAGSSASDAEEALMSIGLDKRESGFGLGKMPSKVVTRQYT